MIRCMAVALAGQAWLHSREVVIAAGADALAIGANSWAVSRQKIGGDVSLGVEGKGPEIFSECSNVTSPV